MNLIYRQYGKRIFDTVVAALLLVLLSPVILITAVAVRVKFGSPVLFKQQRPGLHGEIFTLCKFRTMTLEKDSEGKLLSDADRLTAFGRLLRSSSLDELPQLWNVLKGEMSLVGPRPLLVEYLELYTPEQARRQEVRPGITGLAQVSGRNSLSWDDKFRLDVQYVEKVQFLQDARILVLTVWNTLRRAGVNQQGQATMTRFRGVDELSVESSDVKVIVIGAGGHAKVVISTLRAAGCKVVGLYDDCDEKQGVSILGVPVLGKLEDAVHSRGCSAVIAIGDCQARMRISKSLSLQWMSAIHPTAWIDSSAKVGVGTVVCAGAILQPDSCVGEHSIINTGAIVEHDCSVGDWAHLAPGAKLCGSVEVGQCVFAGAGAVILPGVIVGKGATLGAGAVAVKDVSSNAIAVGCPAAEKLRDGISWNKAA